MKIKDGYLPKEIAMNTSTASKFLIDKPKKINCHTSL